MSNIRLRKGRYRPLSDIECHERPLGQILLDAGRISPVTLVRALEEQANNKLRLGAVLVANGSITTATLSEALARQKDLPHRARHGQITDYSDDDPLFWIKNQISPWSKADGIWQVLVKDDETYLKHQTEIQRRLGHHEFIWSTPTLIESRLQRLFQDQLTARAEELVPKEQSCADLNYAAIKQSFIVAITLIGFGTFFAANMIYLSLLLLGLGLLALNLIYKFYLLFAPQHRPSLQIGSKPTDIRPAISILVPLFRESDIASPLIKRLSRLTYPKAHLEVILILERGDVQTQTMLRSAKLPHWMRVLTVPKGNVQTKPRAMNYTLPFCRGDIIGIYDAEDAPEPDQLEKVAGHFAQAPAEVVCLQGALDFYNLHSDWIARCFTIEYNSWFKATLPALANRRSVLPLGGTTLFFRRTVLEELGAWDAFNVTEDCDLGVRLSRQGYRCEILDSTTYEEANNRIWPWVKQRSRWIKGYYVTYFTHMRKIKSLYADLGIRRFIEFQMLFLPTMILLPIAPLFWSFWAITFGLFEVEAMGISRMQMMSISLIFIGSLAIDLIYQIIGLIRAKHFSLLPWILTTYFYFPLATVASYKALLELCTKPFFWDKTMHGHRTKPTLNPASDG